jgi:MarR family transcriptional regulator, organic hydroperoxide resistance regulator
MTDSPAQLLLDNQLCFLFHRIARDLNAAYRPLLSELGLTYPQYLVMLVLWEEDGRSVKDLGQQLCLDSGTLSPLLRRLDKLGLIERVRDHGDERRVNVVLTDQGRELRRHAEQIPETLGQRLVDSPQEYMALHRQLTSIAARLEA